MKEKILDQMGNTPLGQILDFDDLHSVDWVWINREILPDLLINLKMDVEEEVWEKEIKEITDKELFMALQKPFKENGYIPMNQYLFSQVEHGYKATEDIETIIFVKEAYYRKLSIQLGRKFDWILKAMALDTYFRMGLEYNSLKEAYEDLYEGNTRIIEDILSNGEYQYMQGQWKYIRKVKQLSFYKMNEFFHKWVEGEVISKFEELLER